MASTITDQRTICSTPALTFNDLTNADVFDQIEVNVNRNSQEKLGFRVTQKDSGLILVTSVATNAPITGLIIPGDYIVRINGHKIKSRNKLFRHANKAKTTVTLVVARQKSNSSSSPVGKTRLSDAAMVKKAVSFGFKIKENKDYLLVKVKKKKHKRLALGIKRKKGKVIVSRVESDSYAANVLRVGDYILAINDKKVTDKKVCRDLIVKNSCEFEALIERPMEEDESLSQSLKSTYIEPDPFNVEHELGDPHNNYEPAPPDVQSILNERIPSIMQNFSACVKNSNAESKKTAKTAKSCVNVAPDVICNEIPSDVHPNHFLRKPTQQNPTFD